MESQSNKKKYIKCNDIVKIYKNGTNSVTAIRGISYIFESGTIYVIFGPSGAGKTTLMSILGGLELPSSGTVNFNNSFTIFNESKNSFDFRIKNVSFIFQEPIFLPFLTVYENIKFFAKSKDQVPKERVNEVLETTNLIHRKSAYPYQLSGGEKQRLTIAIALYLNNDVWLCDEPTGTLDTKNKRDIMNLLKKIISNDPTKILIIVTHDPLFQNIADKILILKDGIFDLEMDKKDLDQLSKQTAMYAALDENLASSVQKQIIIKKLDEIKKELDKQ